LHGLEAFNATKKKEGHKATLDRLARRKKQRERALQAAGFSAADAKAIADEVRFVCVFCVLVVGVLGC